MMLLERGNYDPSNQTDNELANEWARCSGKNASYITKIDVRAS